MWEDIVSDPILLHSRVALCGATELMALIERSDAVEEAAARELRVRYA